MSGLRKYTRAQVSRAVRLVSEGQSYARAGRACRMPGSAVRNHCAAAGVLPRSTNGHRTAFAPGARAFSSSEDARIVEARAFGMSFAAIGNELHRSKNSVRSRLLTLQLVKLRGEA